jgi:hypothetical protein
MDLSKKFVLLFAAIPIAAGVLFALPFALRQGASETALLAFWYGVLAGLIMILAFVGFYFLVRGLTPARQRAVIQMREFLVNGNWDECQKRCLQILKNEPFVKTAELDERRGILTAHTKFSWASPGEKITIAVSSTDGNTRIVITSQPLWRTIMIDYGKNFRNVEALKELLQTRLGTNSL